MPFEGDSDSTTATVMALEGVWGPRVASAERQGSRDQRRFAPGKAAGLSPRKAGPSRRLGTRDSLGRAGVRAASARTLLQARTAMTTRQRARHARNCSRLDSLGRCATPLTSLAGSPPPAPLAAEWGSPANKPGVRRE